VGPTQLTPSLQPQTQDLPARASASGVEDLLMDPAQASGHWWPSNDQNLAGSRQEPGNSAGARNAPRQPLWNPRTTKQDHAGGKDDEHDFNDHGHHLADATSRERRFVGLLVRSRPGVRPLRLLPPVWQRLRWITRRAGGTTRRLKSLPYHALNRQVLAMPASFAAPVERAVGAECEVACGGAGAVTIRRSRPTVTSSGRTHRGAGGTRRGLLHG
jgi:hypothetical protein